LKKPDCALVLLSESLSEKQFPKKKGKTLGRSFKERSGSGIHFFEFFYLDLLKKMDLGILPPGNSFPLLSGSEGAPPTPR